MVIEMTLLCFAPRQNSSLLFSLFLINRIFSGTAEAAASGADEAIAYDTLVNEGMADQWPAVLERQMRYRAMFSIAVMVCGAAVYDPYLMQKITDFIGLPIHFTQGITLRFPLFLTLLMAILTLIVAVKMHEEGRSSVLKCVPGIEACKAVLRAFKLTFDAGRWILRTPIVLVIIFAGMFFDNILRMLITLNSQYYRLISLPEATFGLISSLVAILGIFLPRIGRKLVKERTPFFNFNLMVVISFIGLLGLIQLLPYVGLIFIFFLFSVTYLNDFFQSHYLNRLTSSSQRATVLSFKGMAFNLAYGFAGSLYSYLVAFLRDEAVINEPALTDPEVHDLVFIRSLEWFPAYFVLSLIALLIFAVWKLRKNNDYRRIG